MSRICRFVVGLSLLLLACQRATAAQALPPATEWVPQDAVLVLELSRPRDLLEPLLDEKVAETVTALPLYKQQASKQGFKEFLKVIKFLEVTLETDWQTALGSLTGGGVTLAVCPKDTVLLVIDAEDEKLLARLHEILLSFARAEAEKQGQPDRVASAEYQGVTGWTFNGEEAHAIIGRRMIMANRPEGLKAALELRAKKKGAKSLASKPAYLAAKRAAGADSAGVAFVDLKALKLIPQFAEALELDRKTPLSALLFSGIGEAVRASNWAAFGVDVEEGTLVLRALVDGKAADPTAPAAFALPGKPGEGALPNLSVPRRIAGLSFYRDLHRFYAAKDDLFPNRSSELIFFENMMGIFFSGRDLTEEVLSQTRPEVRVVVARQQYDPAVGTPGTQLPAFAAIFRLRDPEKFDLVIEEAWQKAVGLVSFTRGQQAQSGLIIDRLVQGDTKFTLAYFSAAGIEDRANLDQRFNFRPALAMPRDYAILSSTEGLARDLIDALSREETDAAQRPAEIDSLVEIDGGPLAAVLEANRAALIRNNMIEEGNTQEEAETGIEILITLVKSLDRAKLSVGKQQGLTRAHLELKLKSP